MRYRILTSDNQLVLADNDLDRARRMLVALSGDRLETEDGAVLAYRRENRSAAIAPNARGLS